MSSLKGKKAVLLTPHCKCGDSVAVIRIYDKIMDEGFTDYDVYHNDLGIIIDDDDTQIVELAGGNMAIDHSAATLGIEE